MKHGSLANSILRQMVDEAFNFNNLLYRDYNPEVVEHLLRYHFPRLVSLRDDGDLDAVCVYSDLTAALKALPVIQQQVIRLRIAGHTLSAISEKLGVNAARLASASYREMSEFLNRARVD